MGQWVGGWVGSQNPGKADFHPIPPQPPVSLSNPLVKCRAVLPFFCVCCIVLCCVVLCCVVLCCVVLCCTLLLCCVALCCIVFTEFLASGCTALVPSCLHLWGFLQEHATETDVLEGYALLLRTKWEIDNAGVEGAQARARSYCEANLQAELQMLRERGWDTQRTYIEQDKCRLQPLEAVG